MSIKVKIKSDYFNKLLIKLNLSANEFGRKAGLSSAYMSQIVNGGLNPGPQARQKIMDYLNKIASIEPVKFDDLFEIEG